MGYKYGLDWESIQLDKKERKCKEESEAKTKMLALFVLLTVTASIISGQGEPGPKICKENEVWRDCSSCEGQCKDLRYECRHSCQEPKCECPHDLGYVRADDGRCVYHTFCPKMQEDFFHRCHDNKIWHMCSGCEASCENPQPECPQICLEARCECPRELGFAIREYDGKCVPRDLCAPDQAAGKSFHHPPPPPDSLHPFGPGPVRHQLPLGPGPVRHQLPLGPGPVQGVGPRSRMLVPPPVEPLHPFGPGPVRHQLPLGPGPVHQHGHSEESQSHEVIRGPLVGGQRPLPQRRPRDKFQPPDDHPAGGPGPVRPIVPAHDGPGPAVPPRPNVVGGQRPVPVIGPKP